VAPLRGNRLVQVARLGPGSRARLPGHPRDVRETRISGSDPTAVDWLLLQKKTSAVGAEGAKLYATTYIQRINTVGGRAPVASECDVQGELTESDYTADYYFWKASS